jgi:hypothetical protein
MRMIFADQDESPEEPSPPLPTIGGIAVWLVRTLIAPSEPRLDLLTSG